MEGEEGGLCPAVKHLWLLLIIKINKKIKHIKLQWRLNKLSGNEYVTRGRGFDPHTVGTKAQYEWSP